jgi:hypothetical protein
MCCLGRQLQCRSHARSTRAALASTLARATLWREAARVLPRAAASRSLLCSLNATTLASTLARASLWRRSTQCCLGRQLQGRCHARSRAALASMLALATLCGAGGACAA